MALNIITYPNQGLRQKSKKVEISEITQKEFQRFLHDFVKTMKAKDGIGLAAPQVGRHVRIIAVNTKNDPIVLINPRIIKKSWKKNEAEEGCLSLPGIFGMVKRKNIIKVVCHDKAGKKLEFKAKGLFARVILHETDHLDGILFIDKVKKITKGAELLKIPNPKSQNSNKSQ